MPVWSWRTTSRSTIDLLDVSVWVPLSAPDHEHHARARQYWDDESAERVAFCRVTALALLRHLTNPHIMRHAVLTGARAWDEFERWLALPEIVFMDDPHDVDARLQAFARTLDLSPSTWTDAYLAAFAISSGCRLVAFDSDFLRYPDLDLLHLVA